MQFRQLAEPFLLLGEIEQHIRSLIEGKFTQPELSASKDAADTDRTIERVADLTIGECRRLIENPGNWERLKLKVDRVSFINDLERVREIRNDVMHFDPDPFPEADLATLRRFVRFLQRLRQLRQDGGARTVV